MTDELDPQVGRNALDDLSHIADHLKTVENLDFEADNIWRCIEDLEAFVEATKNENGIEWKSDGVQLTLADGRTVRPCLEGIANEDEWIATGIWSTDKFAKYGPEVDHGKVYLSFREVDDDE